MKLDHDQPVTRRSFELEENEKLKLDDEEDEINEELLLTQHMSELSAFMEDDGTEWYTLIGIGVLLLTLIGHSMVGVVANIVPASSGYIMLA